MLTGLEKKPFAKSLKGERLWLERADASYAARLWDCILKDRELRGVSWPGVGTIEELTEYLQSVAGELPQDEVVYMMVLEQEIIGSFHIHNLNHSHHRTEIGYGIQKGYEGYGFVTEAVALVEQELARLKFNRIEIRCSADNTRSVNLAKRNAYRHEGTMIRECIEDGRFRDTMIFAKIIGV